MTTRILDQGQSGHRHDWYNQIKEYSGTKKICFEKNKKFWHLVKLKEPLIISFFDEKKYFFMFILFFRMLLFKQTISFYFSWSNKSPSSRFSLKFLEYYFFFTLSYFLQIKLISLYPSSSKNFLPDLSTFDLLQKNFTDIQEDYYLGFFGSASEVKNFSLFLKLAQKIASEDKKIIIVTNSNLLKDDLQIINTNAHIQLIHSFLEKDEFIRNLASTKFIWANYTKYYDQSSGIFGHASQLRKILLVRQGSILEKSRYKKILSINNEDMSYLSRRMDNIDQTPQSIEYNDSLIGQECLDAWESALKKF